MTDPIRVAIIGAGIGQEHLSAYIKLPQYFTVTYLCDIDQGRAQQVLTDKGADPNVTRLATDFDTVIAQDDVDLVDICLPPHLHFQMSMRALAAKKHVVCEKPLASSLAEADALADAAKEHDRELTPVFQYRYGPEVAKLQALIAAGFAGKPLVTSIETHWHRDAGYYDNPWRGTWDGEKGGAVLGHAIHNHDLLCAILGPVKRLSAFTSTRVNEIEVEDCAAISFEMASGALATSSVTLGAANDTSRFRFCFDKLTAESDVLPYAPADGTWTFTTRGTEQDQLAIDQFLLELAGPPVGFVGFFKSLADALNGRGDNAVTLEDGRRSLELVTAIYLSSRTSQMVTLPLTQDCSLYKSWLPA